MSKPLLSIGLIFKNEIRCLERCLKSLQPLREALPCELVMADTGSNDGSREVAERYADILFDFPWINDFSAARNAVLDRCSGRWFFFLDADEWLDSDFSELTVFLSNDKNPVKSISVVVRNYATSDITGEFQDFYARRLVRMNPGLRFHGTIHEYFPDVNLTSPFVTLHRVILYHDGYAFQSEEQKRKKYKRNITLLRGELEKDPENIRLLLQCVESGNKEPDFLELLHRGVAAVERRLPNWDGFGPPLLRYAVLNAQEKRLPELKTWAAQAEEWFPDSFFTRIDVQYALFVQAWEERNYDQCVHRGELYLQAMDDNRAGRGDQRARQFATLKMESPQWEQQVRIYLAWAYLHTDKAERAAEVLGQINGGDLDVERAALFVLALQELHTRTWYDTAPLVRAFWEQACEPKPTLKKANERKNNVYKTAFKAFTPEGMDEEMQVRSFCRHAYTLYLPLRDKCELGSAAAILETEDGAEMADSLSRVERWDALPIQALTRALDHGVTFPLPGKPLNVEEMDDLARRLATDKENIHSLVGQALTEDFTANGQTLLWALELSMAAMQAFDWNAEDASVDTGLALARSFARAEKAFLPLCYTPQTLREENLFVLPPMHRFGWYCVQAFDALEAGNAVSYVQHLRTGLSAHKDMKDMVEFLLERTPELQIRSEPSAELLALAKQIRTVLANFSPNDPAVIALKQSAAYQKVAHLIEGTNTQ